MTDSDAKQALPSRRRRPVIIAIVVILCGALGYWALVRSRSGGAGAEQGEGSEGPSPLVTVQTGTLQRMTLAHYVTGYGTVAAAPAHGDQAAAATALAAPVAGVVTRVDVVEGQAVKRGQVLVALNSGAMTETFAEQEVTRQKQLYAEHNTSLKNLQHAEAQLALLRVTAPLSGTIVRLAVKAGTAVDANTVVAEVMDLNRLVVKSAIPDSEAGELKPGQPLEVMGGASATAPLAYVSPTVDTNSGTVQVWAALPRHSGLRAGQFVPLRIVTGVHTNCLAAPEESVVTDISGQSVIAVVHGDEAIRRPVETGFRDNGWVEVKGKGMRAGDSVVTVGAYGLPQKTKIQIAHPAAQ